jgi:hypothetical protein
MPGYKGKAEIRAILEPDSAESLQVVEVELPQPRMFLVAKGPVQAGKSSWVSVLVQHPQAGQNVKLTLPETWRLAAGETVQKPVPLGKDCAQINWLLHIDAHSSGDFTLEAVLQPDAKRESCRLSVQAGTLVQ